MDNRCALRFGESLKDSKAGFSVDNFHHRLKKHGKVRVKGEGIYLKVRYAKLEKTCRFS